MRKKFTMLFAALLACVGVAKAQNVVTSTAEDPVYYTIASYNRGGVITYSEVGGAIVHEAYNTNGNSTWYFETVSGNENNGVYIVNKNTDSKGNKLYIGSGKTVSTTPAVWYILPNGVNDYGYSISSSTTVSTYYSCLDASRDNTSIGGWHPTSGDWNGTTWLFLGDVQNATYNPNEFTMQEGTDGRKISSITVNGVTKNTANSNLMYVDHTNNIEFVVFPEDEVAISIDRTGGWMHAYAYVDAYNDGFAEEDVVTYSYYNNMNSEGTEIGTANDAHNTIAMPNFTAPSTPGTYRLRVKYDWDNLNPNGEDGKINVAGGQFVDVTFVVSAAASLTVNYSFTYNGVEKYTQSTSVEVGAALPAITVEFPYGLTATQPEGTANEEDATDGVITKVIALENTLPFEPAAAYDDENMTWYYLKFHSNNGYYLHHDADQGYIDLNSKAVDKNNKDAYTWAFVGDVFEGFKIVNRATGNGYILSSSTTMAGETGAETWPVMTEEANLPEGNNTYWIPTSSSHITNGFFLAQKDYPTNRMNDRGKLAYWTGGAGAGSTFWVEVRPMGPAAELTALVEEIEAMGVVGGTNIGDYTEASVTALNNAVTAAKAVKTATADDVTTLQAALDGLRVVLPDANKFYYFDCTYQGDGEEIRRKLHINNNNQLNWVNTQAAFDAAGSRAIFQFEAGSTPNTVKIKSVHTQSYMGAISGNITFGETGEDITIARSNSNEVSDDLKPYAVMFTTDGSTGIHANTSPVSAYTNGAGSNHYVLTEVTEFSHTLTIDEYDYMTLVLGFNAVVPEGVTVSKVTGVNEKELVMDDFAAGDVIPAGEAVIVYAEVAEGATVTAEFAYTATAATESTDNLLKGTLVDNSAVTPTADKDAYVMGLNNGVVMMGKATLTDGVFRNRANKAYLELPQAETNAAMYSFGRGGDAEDTTGIEQLAGDYAEVVIYDLAGRRVAKMEKGIYIVNGKKVVVK